MSGTGTQTAPIGIGLVGSWVRLEAVGEANHAELVEVQARRNLNPAMGADNPGSPRLVPAMLIRDQRTGVAVGIVDNFELPGRIAVCVAYVDQLRRAAAAMEAVMLYVSTLFDGGARLVDCEVIEFNRPMIRAFERCHLPLQVRMRQHVYSAGRLWDLLVYSFNRDEWVTNVLNRYRAMLPEVSAAAGTGAGGDSEQV